MTVLRTLEEADDFVDNTDGVFWDGYDIVVFVASPLAESDPKGLFHNGRWLRCIQRISPGSSGWVVDDLINT